MTGSRNVGIPCDINGDFFFSYSAYSYSRFSFLNLVLALKAHIY